jgi:hypothetical protein
MRRTLAILVELGEAALDHASLLILEALGAGHCVVGGRLALDCWWQRGLPASGVMHDRVGRVARLRAIHAVDGTTLFCDCTASGGRPPSLKLPDSTRTDANCGWEVSRRVGKDDGWIASQPFNFRPKHAAFSKTYTTSLRLSSLPRAPSTSCKSWHPELKPALIAILLCPNRRRLRGPSSLLNLRLFFCIATAFSRRLPFLSPLSQLSTSCPHQHRHPSFLLSLTISWPAMVSTRPPRLSRSRPRTRALLLLPTPPLP